MLRAMRRRCNKHAAHCTHCTMRARQAVHEHMSANLSTHVTWDVENCTNWNNDVIYQFLFWNLFGISEISQNFSKFLKISQNFSKFLKISQNFSKFLKISQKFSRVRACNKEKGSQGDLKISQNFSKFLKISQNFSKLLSSSQQFSAVLSSF